jgi:hypothetical protein
MSFTNHWKTKASENGMEAGLAQKLGFDDASQIPEIR